MKTLMHAVIGFLGTAMITLFFVSSIVVELNGDEQAVAWVKQMIVYALFALVPLMIITGISGRVIAGARQGRLIRTKMKRMKFVAANGALILIPCAVALNELAAAGTFNATFYALQGIELVAGAFNIGLMGLNIRDGFFLTGRVKGRPGGETLAVMYKGSRVDHPAAGELAGTRRQVRRGRVNRR